MNIDTLEIIKLIVDIILLIFILLYWKISKDETQRMNELDEEEAAIRKELLGYVDEVLDNNKKTLELCREIEDLYKRSNKVIANAVMENLNYRKGTKVTVPVKIFGDPELMERICQFRIQKNQPETKFVFVDSLGNEDRGGFGTSGKN